MLLCLSCQYSCVVCSSRGCHILQASHIFQFNLSSVFTLMYEELSMYRWLAWLPWRSEFAEFCAGDPRCAHYYTPLISHTEKFQTRNPHRRTQLPSPACVTYNKQRLPSYVQLPTATNHNQSCTCIPKMTRCKSQLLSQQINYKISMLYFLMRQLEGTT